MESPDSPVMSEVKIEMDVAEDMSLDWRTTTTDMNTPKSIKTEAVTDIKTEAVTDIKTEAVTDIKTEAVTDIMTEAVTDTDAWKRIKIKCEPVDSVAVNQDMKPAMCDHQETDTDRQTQPADDTADSGDIVMKFEPVKYTEEEAEEEGEEDGEEGEEGETAGLPQPVKEQIRRKPSTSTSTAHGGDEADADQTTVLQTRVNITGTPSSMDSPYVCQHCSAAFGQLSCLREHAMLVHKEQMPGCGRCQEETHINCPDKLLVRGDYHQDLPRSQLKEDLRIHTCDECGKGFTLSKYLKEHKKTHTRHKPFVCDECGKAFTLSKHLKVHQRSHTGYKPYVCDVCNKAFTQSGNLQVHKTTHTGHRPFICDVCSKAFATSSDLNRHVMRIHTSYRPFVCDVCSKAFTYSYHLKYHQTTHTSDKPYVCEVCDKAFTRSRDLQAHKTIHTGQKPFTCDVCSKGYTTSSNLKAHRRDVHRLKCL